MTFNFVFRELFCPLSSTIADYLKQEANFGFHCFHVTSHQYILSELSHVLPTTTSVHLTSSFAINQ